MEEQQGQRELKDKIAHLEAEAKRARRDRQVLLMLTSAAVVLLLGVKIEVDGSGRRSFSFDGSSVRVETLLQVTSIVLLGGAGVHALNGRRDDPQ